MEKKFTKFTIAAMKRTAENVNQFIGKRDRLVAKIAELQNELDIINASIEAADAPTKMLTGGFGSEDLFDKVVTDTGKVNKDGNPIKVTKFVLKYPETVTPVIDVEMVQNLNPEVHTNHDVDTCVDYESVEELPNPGIEL